MAEDPPNVSTLKQLQTPQQVQLLDTIDVLRKQGLERHGVSLPQLIVCGGQSSGKSSLLEGLTSLRFPTDDGTCTTFPSEVIMREKDDVEIECTIIPGKSRTMAEQQELKKFRLTYSSLGAFRFPSIITEARKCMAFEMELRKDTFFDDVLHIEYSGPNVPSLTIVDLPGIIEKQLEGGDGAQKVLEIVKSYMLHEKSIILAVIDGSHDADTQKIWTPLEQCDPKGLRTMGIITKPDKADSGSHREKLLVKLASNERYAFKYRWHVVRNRCFKTKNHSDAERDELERKFFASGVWSSFPRKDVGIEELRLKLSHVLLEHIGNELPSLVTKIQEKIAITQSGLKRLGDARETCGQQRRYLTGHAEKFQALTNDALRGFYNNPFFALSTPHERTSTRLRTEIQNLNIAFAHIMYRKGHTWNISHEQPLPMSSMLSDLNSSPISNEYDAYVDEPTYINRIDFLKNHIGEYVRQSRPSGLPSYVNPYVPMSIPT